MRFLGDPTALILLPNMKETVQSSAPSSPESAIRISVVVPVFDEEANLPILHEEIVAALDPLGVAWEVLYVDDRSLDQSLVVMLELWKKDGRVRVVKFRARSGQTAAMAAGFDHARGEIVVTLDGDLQNDPADIPKLVAELERGFDVVAGWRKSRQDGFVLRKLPSKIANRLIAWVTGVQIHDTGCTLKAFRREVVKNLPIYAEQHRFLPAMSAGGGARVSEMVVNHRPRRFGRSKYGIGRATRVLLDLLSIKMISSFSHRPLQYFALLTAPFVLGLFGYMISLAVAKAPIDFDTEWGRIALVLFMLLFMLCAYFVMLGLLAELVVKASGMHQPRHTRVLVSGPRSGV
ncbi:MAG: glycosyltransferase family 2 protein [Planctomycetota bacterium]|nr:glycosyltransferase family 2 protein [Planctomycetota bacterium]